MALAWGGYKNGQIPLSKLTSVGNGQYLRSDVARQLELMLDAYVADTGNARPHVNSGYRSLADQQWMLDHPAGQLVAAVGFSTHGWGITPDLSDTGRHPVTPFSAWLDEHAEEYGFRRTIASESWHYQGGFPATITAALDSTLIDTRITDQEHDMQIIQNLKTKAYARVGEFSSLALAPSVAAQEAVVWMDGQAIAVEDAAFNQAVADAATNRRVLIADIIAALPTSGGPTAAQIAAELVKVLPKTITGTLS